MLDFDGTLSEIVPRPELSTPVDGARDVLARLVEAFAVVAIVTGRRSDDTAERLGVEGVRILGLYGFEDQAPDDLGPVVGLARSASAAVPEAWVEDKGGSLAVHYRQAPNPVDARATLMRALAPVAAGAGLELIEGKMVVELIPPGRPMKGGAVERVVVEHHLRAVLYAGDDHADLDAFAALARLRVGGTPAIRVAVRGAETPDALVAAADLVVDGPSGLVELLRQLV